MRFREIFGYELAYRLRSVSTWFYAGVLFLLGFYLVHVSASGTNAILANAPLRVAEMTALACGLFGMLVTAGLYADAVTRDYTVRMDPLLFTTRIRPGEYLGGRFLAALAINAILVLAGPLGMAIATKMPYLDAAAFGPNSLALYLQPVVLFLLPNLVLIATILFTIAALTRRTIPVYLGAIGVVIAYIVALSFWDGIANPLLSALADPLGVNAFRDMTKYWPAVERNSRLVGFPSILVWNRVLWLAIAAALFAVLYRVFRFVDASADGRTFRRTRRDGNRAEEVDDAPRPSVAIPQHAAVFGRHTHLHHTLAVMRQSLAEVMSGWAFIVAFVAAIGLVILWGWNIGETLYETITWPVTHLVAGVVLSQRAVVILWLVIIVYAGELVWKERETGASEIADALPVRTFSSIAGRFFALVAIIVMFQLAFLIGGVLLQVLHGYYDFEPGLYLRILFGIKLVDYVLLAVLAMTVHVLVNHKYVGHAIVLLLVILSNGALAGTHHLLRYNSGPEWTYSEMNGFAPFVETLLWLKLYWLGWAALFAVATFLFWARGPESGIRERFSTARGRFTKGPARAATIAIVAILLVGGFVYYNTNVLNEWVAPQKSGRTQAEFERRYAKYREFPQPEIASAELRFEIYPDEPALDARGSYLLANRTAAPIRTVHVQTPHGRSYVVRSLTFDRPAKPELIDAQHGYRIFALERPLAPGESLRLSFDVSLRPRGFAHGGNQTSIVANGSYFDRRLVPFIGYQAGFEIADAAARKRLGLPAKRLMPAPDDPDAGDHFSSVDLGERVPVETIVGTAPDQIAVVPGMLRRSWTENGRRYFHYATRVPEGFTTAVFSGRYAVRKGEWKNPATGEPVALEVLHHPQHRYNVDRMIAGMKASLDYYTSVFGPYPYRELRIVEIPPYSINGRAFPSAIAFAEQNFITRAELGLVDLTFFGTAHEVAHQWWGGQVRPAYAAGRGFVSEALANYSAMLVTEKVLGPVEANRVFDFQMDRYLRRRGETGKDAPLLSVDEHPHVAYGKGAVVLWTLRERIGEQALHTALRRFLEKYRQGGPPYATSLDLYAELRAVTPASQQALLADLVETMTFWDVSARKAATRRLADGRWEVTFDLTAEKMRADRDGTETEVPMNDFVQVGVFTANSDKPLSLGLHRLRSGDQTLRMVVPQKPSTVALDPDGKLFERERGDNVAEAMEE